MRCLKLLAPTLYHFTLPGASSPWLRYCTASWRAAPCLRWTTPTEMTWWTLWWYEEMTTRELLGKTVIIKIGTDEGTPVSFSTYGNTNYLQTIIIMDNRNEVKHISPIYWHSCLKKEKETQRRAAAKTAPRKQIEHFIHLRYNSLTASSLLDIP